VDSGGDVCDTEQGLQGASGVINSVNSVQAVLSERPRPFSGIQEEYPGVRHWCVLCCCVLVESGC